MPKQVQHPLLLRPALKTTTHMYQMASNGRCWHFDAWIVHADLFYYLVVETRKGGRHLLQRHVYTINERRRGGPFTLRMVTGYDMSGMQAIRLCDLPPALYERFNRLHWDFIVPMTQRKPDAFTSRSVVLHYCAVDRVAPFDPGMINYFRYERKPKVA